MNFVFNCELSPVVQGHSVLTNLFEKENKKNNMQLTRMGQTGTTPLVPLHVEGMAFGGEHSSGNRKEEITARAFV